MENQVLKSMKIVQVIPSLRTGGAERLVLDITSELQRLGHEVFIITFRQGNHFPQLSEGKHIETIPSTVSYSITGKDCTDTNEFDRRIREIRPDIVHSHLFESELISRHQPMPGVHYITHCHGMYFPTAPRHFADYLTKDGWWNWNALSHLKHNYKKCNNQFLCISNYITDYAKEVFAPNPTSIHTILNGCDILRFGNYARENDSETFDLVAVGSFHTYKNQIFLLKVILQLVEYGVSDVRLKLLGDGAERNNLESFSVDNGLTNYVDFLGYVNNPGDFMSRGDALVHGAPNEPFGLIFLEAMSMGLPIVAFNSGGIPEIVENEKTGLLTNANDVEEFASAILKLKDDPQLATQYGEEGKHAVQKFGMDIYVKKIEDLYYRLLKQD